MSCTISVRSDAANPASSIFHIHFPCARDDHRTGSKYPMGIYNRIFKITPSSGSVLTKWMPESPDTGPSVSISFSAPKIPESKANAVL